MKKILIPVLIISAAAIGIAMLLRNRDAGREPPGPSYIVETIELPPGLTGEVGGLGFLPGGSLIACFHRGEVMIYDPETTEWKLFASGLHDPLGLLVVSDTEVLVMQQPELTRLVDTDADGVADVYEKVTDEFGLSGNYHEFNYGPVADEMGNLFFTLNAASYGGSIRDQVRGTLNLLGRDGPDAQKQFYSVVPYRGWVMQLSATGELIPIASGLRSPNGIGFDTAGHLLVTENQGDWVPTNALYHIRKGHFYGHPASLVWEEDWGDKSPFSLSAAALDSMRTKAAVLFPQDIMSNSPAQPLCDTSGGRFGPFTGQLFIGEMNHNRILRVMLEEVGGQLQGAVIPFIDGRGLRKGNNRLAFGPDGSLWVGQTDHGWAGARGIQRIVYTGKTPFDIQSMRLTENGFDLEFTRPVNKEAALDTSNYNFRSYAYKYYKKGPGESADEVKMENLEPVPVSTAALSADGKTVSLRLDRLRAGYIYELKLGAIPDSRGDSLTNRLICYTLNQLQ